MEVKSPRGEKDGAHIMVRLPGGGEVHEFVLPLGYTVDQVKRAIFREIPELSNEPPTDYNLGIKEQVLAVEFSKLRSVAPNAGEQVPIEFSVIAKRPEIRYGLKKPTPVASPQDPRAAKSVIEGGSKAAPSPKPQPARAGTAIPAQAPAASAAPAASQTTPTTSPTITKSHSSRGLPTAAERQDGQLAEARQALKESANQVKRLDSRIEAVLDALQKRAVALPKKESVHNIGEYIEKERAFLYSVIEIIEPEARKHDYHGPYSPTTGKVMLQKAPKQQHIKTMIKGQSGIDTKNKESDIAMPPVTKLTPEERAKMLQAEFLETEESYVASLKFLVEGFLDPMIKQASALQISPETIDIIFSKELRMLLKMHEELLADLKNPDKPFTTSLGLFMPFLKLYSVYVNNNVESRRVLIEWTSSSKKFQTFLAECAAKSPKQLDLASYLIMPVQRLPRYEMLLRDLVKYTTQERDRKELSKLLDKVKELNTHINESRRKKDNTEKLIDIQKRIGAKKKINLFDRQNRELVKEGNLQVLASKEDDKKQKLVEHHLFLFDDILVDTTPKKENKLKLVGYWYLTELNVKRVEGQGEDEQRSATVKVKDLEFTLKASSPEEIESWVNAIHKGAENFGKEQPTRALTVDLTGLIGESLTTSLN